MIEIVDADKFIDAISKELEDTVQQAQAALAAQPAMKSFSTGAVRSNDADKAAFTLLSPVGLRRIAETCQEGSAKYGDYNWEKGMPVREMLEHALQHIFKYLDGDRSEDHLAHAGWNMLGAIHSEERWPELNNNLRPVKK